MRSSLTRRGGVRHTIVYILGKKFLSGGGGDILYTLPARSQELRHHQPKLLRQPADEAIDVLIDGLVGLLLWLCRFLNQFLLLGFVDLLDLRLLGPAAIQHDAELISLVGLVPVVLVAVDLVPLVLLLDAGAVFEAEAPPVKSPRKMIQECSLLLSL